MTNAYFHNFRDIPFTGHWNGKPKTFKPGEKVLMPAWLAEHFAKHLTNDVLIQSGKETYTSPKRPAEVPVFMEIFNKCFQLDKPAEGANEVDELISSAKGEPSMDIEVVEPKLINDGPASAADPYLPSGGETGPGGASTVIGEVADEDEYDDGATNGASAE